MRILLIEDEAALAAIMRKGLEKAQFAVDWAPDGEAGLEKATEEGYALIILDLMLPGRDGWGICRELRARRDTTPILMLTARDAVRDRVRGLEMGADDYLTKPFDFKELRARVRALLRRDSVNKCRIIRIADLEVDTRLRRVTRGEQDIFLTPREYTLLEALAARQGQVLAKELIQERVWLDPDSHSNTVEVHIAALRKKIDAGRDVKLIHTVHRQGYLLSDADPETRT